MAKYEAIPAVEPKPEQFKTVGEFAAALVAHLEQQRSRGIEARLSAIEARLFVLEKNQGFER
jgi:hypothetical protein